jgi:hypothetical protein
MNEINFFLPSLSAPICLFHSVSTVVENEGCGKKNFLSLDNYKFIIVLPHPQSQPPPSLLVARHREILDLSQHFAVDDE